MKVGVVTVIPTPYRDPLWGQAAKLDGVELEVFFCRSRKPDRPWTVDWELDFKAHFLPSWNLFGFGGSPSSCYWNPGMVAALNSGDYEALVISGYNHLTMLAAIGWAMWRGIPYFLLSEVHLGRSRPLWVRFLKLGWVRFIVSRAAGCFPTGQLASEYLRYYGASPRRIWPIPNTPDVEALVAHSRDLIPRRTAMRRHQGLGGEKVVLFVGRLIERKRVDVLIRAFSSVRKAIESRLVIIGDGPLKARLVALSEASGVAAYIDFRGFLGPSALPEWYLCADLFVLPSQREPWGVVVLEALACGLPVVVTEGVGCHPDVVNDPRIGSVVAVGDVRALAAGMVEQLTQNVAREEIHERWSPVRRRLSYRSLARRMVGCLRRFGTERGELGACP